MSYSEVLEAREVAEPILEDINYRSPSFEDDFSVVDNAWSFNAGDGFSCNTTHNPETEIVDNTMKIELNPDCEIISFSYPGLNYDNYVLEMDIDFWHTSGDLEFRMDYQGERYSELDFWLDGGSNWKFQKLEYGNIVEEYGSKARELDFPGPITVMIIKKDSKFIVYIDSDLVTYIKDLEMYSEGASFGFTVSDWASSISTWFTIDNFKVWSVD